MRSHLGNASSPPAHDCRLAESDRPTEAGVASQISTAVPCLLLVSIPTMPGRAFPRPLDRISKGQGRTAWPARQSLNSPIDLVALVSKTKAPDRPARGGVRASCGNEG